MGGAEFPAGAPAAAAAAAAAADAAVRAPAPPYVSFQVAAPPSGVLAYNPNGTTLNGAGFSAFLVAAQKQSAVTGARLGPCRRCPPTRSLCADQDGGLIMLL